MSLHYCPDCRLLVSHCICAQRPSCVTGMHWRLLMHPNEANKRNNSGFHVQRLLGAKVRRVYWDRRAQQEMATQAALDGQQPVLLFPKHFAVESAICSDSYLGEWSNRPLMILDATWQQARKMYRQSSWLQSLDVWSLPIEQKQAVPELADFQYRLRKNQATTGCSTIETVAFVTHLLGETAIAEQMLNYFELFQRDDNDPSH
ncbi:DTW domain-containing protein [Litoribrevibacter euphylliae]|uniref:tRNA-uridine aminocarboxypropyltransferase n=1 Tax=Litoribrevibacter euphylliae TaxID=1834034 RepID=A0ABV7HH03_9GAMM